MKLQYLFAILFISILNSVAWAGFGPVKFTEVPYNSDSQTSTIALFDAPHVFIEPDGSGQAIWFRNEIKLDQTVKGKIYSHRISANNDVQEAVLLAEVDNAVTTISFNDVNNSPNGNAILFYLEFLDKNDTSDYNAWTLYYDADSGWHPPSKITSIDNAIEIQLFLDSEGTAYAIHRIKNDVFTIYQYQSDKTWKNLASEVEADSVTVGANDRLYRIHDGDTEDTKNDKYISFFNLEDNSWDTPIIISQDKDNERIFGLLRPLVSSDGDIFVFYYKLDLLSSSAFMIMRHYDSSEQSWLVDGDALHFEITETQNTPLALMPFFTNSNAGQVEIMNSVIFNADKQYNIWKTIRYTEKGGWQTTEELFSKAEESGSRTGATLSMLGNFIETDGNGNAVVLMCRNNCKDKFAKIFNPANGWSDELSLPGLGPDTGNTCSLEKSEGAMLSPRMAINQNGEFIATSGLNVKRGGLFNIGYFIATTTGDIKSASSDTSCSTRLTNPAAPNDSGNGSNTGNDSIDDGGSDSSSGAIGHFGLFVLLLTAYCFRKRKFRKRL